MTDEGLDAAVQLHIDVHAHLVNVREWFHPETGERRTGSAVCCTCREVIGETTFNSYQRPLDHDAIDWAEHELYLLEHEYGPR